MKYYTISNKEWKYEDIIDEEILVFECPDVFDFHNVELLREFFKDSGIYWEEYQKFFRVPIDDAASFIFDSPDNLLTRWIDMGKLFLKWLEKKYNVRVLPTENL